MKKIFYGALIGLIFVIVILIFGANTNGAPVLTYVYSNSMEPLINVNDAFLVWPDKNLKVGDIIMYRPVVLKAAYITHRIAAIGETGFITKGDNSPSQDQESGEPEVLKDRIVGKVVTIQGKPLIIPGVGKLASGTQSGFGLFSRYLSGLFLISGILVAFISSRHTRRRPKPRRRLRLCQVYKAITIIAVGSVIVSIYLGSHVTQIEYLVSEYPGDINNRVEVNKPDTLSIEIKNNGLVPVWSEVSGITPLSVQEAPELIWPLSKKAAVLNVLPQRKTGVYHGYVQVYDYPVLLPRRFITFLHRINPLLAILLEGLAIGLYMALFFKMLEHIHGFEGFIPLRAIKDKITGRRMKHVRAQLFGKRR